MNGYSVTPSLIRAAEQIFNHPFADQNAREEVLYLLDWAENQGIEGAGQLGDDLLNDIIDLEALQIDYTALFINSYPAVKAQPYAGWYLGNEMYFGPASETLQNLYLRYGVWLEENVRLPADHIIVELEFVAAMLEQYLSTGNQEYQQALNQMANHLEKWVYKFLINIKQGAQTNYYQVMAKTLCLLLTGFNLEVAGGGKVG